MTLFPEVQRAAAVGRYLPPADEPKSDEPNWLTNAGELVEVLKMVCDRERVADEDRERVVGFRTRTAVANWTIAPNLTPDKVTSEIWEGHVMAAIQGAIRDVFEGLGQNNGRWMLLDYEVRTGKPRGSKVEKLALKMVLVDIMGNEDLKYENNRVVVAATGTQAALAQLGTVAGSDPEVKALLVGLTKLLMAKEGASLDAAPTETAEAAQPKAAPIQVIPPKHQRPGRKSREKVKPIEG